MFVLAKFGFPSAPIVLGIILGPIAEENFLRGKMIADTDVGVFSYFFTGGLNLALIALCLLFYDWRLMIACLWGVPVAFGLLFGSRKIAAQNSEVTKKPPFGSQTASRRRWRTSGRYGLPTRRSGIWPASMRRSTSTKKVTIRGELTTGLFVNAASVIMRLGVATTI